MLSVVVSLQLKFKKKLIKKNNSGDHIHCCPKDHQCDPKKGRCTRKIDQLKDIQCPDGISFQFSLIPI